MVHGCHFRPANEAIPRAKCYQVSHSHLTMDWKNDKKLAEEIRMYARQNLRKSEILDFIQRDYSYYRWSLTSLDRRMRYFNRGGPWKKFECSFLLCEGV